MPDSHAALDADDGAPARHRALRERAAHALRMTIERLVATEAPEPLLAEVAVACERLRDLLPPAVRKSRYEPCRPGEADLSFDEPFDTDVVIGVFNPIAAPYVLESREAPVVLSARFSLTYEGVPGQVHGAHLMSGCDWAMGVAAANFASGVVTGTMSTRFLAPAPIGALIRIEAHPDRVEGRKLFTRATVTADDVVCATAEAIFISRQGFGPSPQDRAGPIVL